MYLCNLGLSHGNLLWANLSEKYLNKWQSLGNLPNPGRYNANRNVIFLTVWRWGGRGRSIRVYIYRGRRVSQTQLLSLSTEYVADPPPPHPPWQVLLCVCICFCSAVDVKGAHRRRIKTEEKTKVVAAVWGSEYFQFLAALAFLH